MEEIIKLVELTLEEFNQIILEPDTIYLVTDGVHLRVYVGSKDRQISNVVKYESSGSSRPTFPGCTVVVYDSQGSVRYLQYDKEDDESTVSLVDGSVESVEVNNDKLTFTFIDGTSLDLLLLSADGKMSQDAVDQIKDSTGVIDLVPEWERW